MTTSFYNGVAGLISFQTGIDIWGDNISNINTFGFKGKTPDFDTIFSTSLIGSQKDDIGLGSTITSSSLDLSQGSLIETQNKFDLAIGGDGWFKVGSGNNEFFTRNGAFSKDAEGFLVNDKGMYLLVANANNLTKTQNGYIITNSNPSIDVLNSTLLPISLPNNVTLPEIPTKNISITTNLNTDTPINSNTKASENLFFSALYDKDGYDLNIRDSQDLIFGFGNKTTYNKGEFSSTFCIQNDEVDGKDLNISLTLNGKKIEISLPDGSNSEDIANAIEIALNENGFDASVNENELTIKTKDKFILSSNYLQNTAAAKLIYSNSPQNEFEFATPKDFVEKLKTLANIAYPNNTEIGFSNGKFYIKNLADTDINAFAIPAENTNENFLKNLDRLANVILPNTASSSLEFLSNTQSYGGDIIQNGKKNISFTFTKEKVENNKTSWLCDIKLQDNLITTTTFTFDDKGNLVEPKTLKLPEFNINFNITSFSKKENKINYLFNHDGVEEGYLKDYKIEDNGNILASFSNNKEVLLGVIPIFHFQNDQGIDSIGDSLFTITDNSNQALLYSKDNTYLPGASIISGSLENSNVNMTTAMTELIVNQKAFSASAKTVTTSDEMIQKAINLKR